MIVSGLGLGSVVAAGAAYANSRRDLLRALINK